MERDGGRRRRRGRKSRGHERDEKAGDGEGERKKGKRRVEGAERRGGNRDEWKQMVAMV